MSSQHWYLNFATGESRPITREENAQMAMEYAKRTKVKNGIVYIDCDPPEDEEEQ